MIPFDQLLSRADSAWLQEQVGSGVLRLLGALDRDNERTYVMREALSKLIDPRRMLASPASRKQLFELLRPSEATGLAAALNLTGEPYGALNSISLTDGSTRHELCCLFFGLSTTPKEHSEISPATQVAAAQYALFDHQRLAVNELERALTVDGHRVLLHMPTGAGKTRMAMHAVAWHLGAHEGDLVIWLANSEELCDQAADEFLKAWSYLGNRDVPLHRYWGQRQLELSAVTDGFLIAGFAKLYSKAAKQPAQIARLGDKASLVVIDEAHQAIAPTYKLLIDGLTARKERMPVLGLTATPGRTYDDPDADLELAKFFGRKKITLRTPGYASPVDFLVAKGFLAEPTFRKVEYVSSSLTVAELRELEGDLEIPSAILVKLASDEVRSLRIVREIEELSRSHQRLIVFSTTVDHAILLTAVLNARGIDARSITAKSGYDDRQAAIEWYREDFSGARILINFGVLTAGFDAPRTSAVLIARPTKSLVLYSQMVGRAIRGPRAGGNAAAEIVTVVDTSLPGFGDLAEAFTNWEDVW